MRFFVFLVILFAQSLFVGCGQSTYDERLKANIDNPKRMSAGDASTKEEEQEPEEEDSGEWMAEDLEADDNATNE